MSLMSGSSEATKKLHRGNNPDLIMHCCCEHVKNLFGILLARQFWGQCWEALRGKFPWVLHTLKEKWQVNSTHIPVVWAHECHFQSVLVDGSQNPAYVVLECLTSSNSRTMGWFTTDFSFKGLHMAHKAVMMRWQLCFFGNGHLVDRTCRHHHL